MLLAVDIGNSKADLLLFDFQGNVHHWIRTGRLVPNELGADGTAEALHSLTAPWKTAITATWAGVAGVDFEDQAQMLRRSLEDLPGLGAVEVHNDIDALLHLSDDDHPARIAVVLGAGMNAVGTYLGQEARFAALGESSGDRGGGGYIAMQALIAACRDVDRRGPRTELARAVPELLGFDDTDSISRALAEKTFSKHRLLDLVPLVFDLARVGDSVAKQIVESQADEIRAVASALGIRLGFQLTDAVIIGGGSILRFGRDLIEPHLVKSTGDSLRIVVPDAPPILGAAKALLKTDDAAQQLVRTLASLSPTLVPVPLIRSTNT